MQEREEEHRDELRGQAHRSVGTELGPQSSAETLLGSSSQASIVRGHRGRGRTGHRGLSPLLSLHPGPWSEPLAKPQSSHLSGWGGWFIGHLGTQPGTTDSSVCLYKAELGAGKSSAFRAKRREFKSQLHVH